MPKNLQAHTQIEAYGVVYVRFFSFIFSLFRVTILTAVSQYERLEWWERLIGCNIVAAIVQRFNFIVFHVIAAAIFPVFHR